MDTGYNVHEYSGIGIIPRSPGRSFPARSGNLMWHAPSEPERNEQASEGIMNIEIREKSSNPT